MDFPGSITIDWKRFVDYLLDIGKSLIHHGFRRFLFVNGHGSNVPLVEMAARLLMLERRDVIAAAFWYLSTPESAELLARTRDSDSPGGMAHACELETSLYLAIHPELVQMDKAVREIPDWDSDARLDGLERRPALDQGPVERLDGVRRDRRRHRRHRREGPALARAGRVRRSATTSTKSPAARRGRAVTIMTTAPRSRCERGRDRRETDAGSLRLAATAAVLVVAAGCGGGSSSDDSGGGTGSGPHKGGILTVGTTNYIDSLNPFHYIERSRTTRLIVIYPQLVQYALSKDDPNKLVIVGDWADSWEHSADGKDWTFQLKPDTKWSDGQPMTAEDAAWTINTIVKYRNGPTAVAAAGVAHVKERRGDRSDDARHPLRRPGRQRAASSWRRCSSCPSTSGSR